MSSEPKKRGRPRKQVDSVPQVVVNASTIDVNKLDEMQKRNLLEQLNAQLNIKEPKTANSRQCQFRKNKFVDDGSLCKEDKKFTKAVEFTVPERVPRNAGVEAVCEKCQKKYIKYFGEYLCQGCSAQ